MYTSAHSLKINEKYAEIQRSNYYNTKRGLKVTYRVVHSNWPVRFLNKFSVYNVATETCNTAMEREYSWLFDDTFENCKNLSYEAEFSFFWQVAELANKLIY